MARDIFINGPALVQVKGAVNTSIGSLTQLGLAESAIRVSPAYYHDPIIVDAMGPNVPMDEQVFLAEARVTMDLVHYDRTVIDACLALAMAGSTAGTMVGAGTRMGGGVARFAAGNCYIGLNISSPVAGKPWRFLYAKLDGNPAQFPLGTKRSIVQLTWLCIPYMVDPWNSGAGSAGAVVWDYTSDT